MGARPHLTHRPRGGDHSWLEANDIRPRVVGEFYDSALLKAFGATADAVFVAPLSIAPSIERQYGARVLGTTPVIERFFAITAERRMPNAVVEAVLAGALRRAAAGEEFAPATPAASRPGESEAPCRGLLPVRGAAERPGPCGWRRGTSRTS